MVITLLLMVGCSQHGRIETDGRAESMPGSASNSEIEVQLYQQALLFLDNNELDKAEPILRTFSLKHPELAGPWANLGLIQLKRGNMDNAEGFLKEALTKNPKLPQAFNQLGVIEQNRGNALQAEQLYLQAIKENNDYAIAHYNIALLYDIYLQEIDKAISHYESYLELSDYKDQQTINWLKQLKSIREKSSR